MVSFQCSRYATGLGIINAFKQCASMQENQDLDKFVSVVVLDEVGLAEDSENMPLKVVNYVYKFERHPCSMRGCHIIEWIDQNSN